jgi:hypothetical protein
MRQKKLYCDGGEVAYGIDWWQDTAFDRQEDVIIELQKADFKGEMWCAHHGEFVERGCNKDCDGYTPCNGKSGRCSDMKNGLTGTGIKYVVSPDRKVNRLAKAALDG